MKTFALSTHIARLLGAFLIVLFVIVVSTALAQQNSVQVFMQVGNTPANPVLLLSVDPSTEPVLVNLNGSRTINFEVNPNVTNNPISWVATVSNGGGSVGPMSGTIDTSTMTRDYFDFLAPAGGGASTVTLRLFDSLNPNTPVSTRTISLYTF